MTVQIPPKMEGRLENVMVAYRNGQRARARQLVNNLTKLELSYLLMYQHQLDNGMVFDPDGVEDFARFVINALHQK